MTGVEPGKVDKVEVKTGLRAGGDDQERNQSQRKGAVPKQAGKDQDEEEVQPVEELLMVCVLHLPHAG